MYLNKILPMLNQLKEKDKRREEITTMKVFFEGAMPRFGVTILGIFLKSFKQF